MMMVTQFMRYGKHPIGVDTLIKMALRRVVTGVAFVSVVWAFFLSAGAYAMDNTKEINIVSMNSPKHLSLFDHTAPTAQEILYQNIFEGLVRYNANGKMVTGLARAWSHTIDYKQWTFELRRNVLFHDGAQFSADDVIFTFRNIKSSNLGTWNTLFDNIAFVKKDSPWRVVFILKRPVQDFLKYLARPEAVIVNSATWFNNKTQPNGTGPFMYSTFEQGKQLVLLKNHSYWDSLGWVDKVVYTFNHPIEQAVQDMKMGKYHGIIGIKNAKAISNLDTQKFQVMSHAGAGVLQLVVNQNRGALAQHPVRVAIAHALNRPQMVDEIMRGHASVATDTVMAYDSLDGEKPRYEFSLEKARDIVNRSGYNQGLAVKISIQDTPQMHMFAFAIKKQIEQANINVIIVPIPVDKWYTHIRKNKDFEMALTLSQGEFNILDYSSPNYFNYHNDDMNTLVDSVIASETVDAKMMAMGRIQSMMADDAIVIPIIKLNYISVLDKEIKTPKHSNYRPQFLLNETYIEF